MAIKVFVDSGADLRGDLIQAMGIVAVPLSIHFGAAVYKDSVDLMPDDFYRLLATSPDLPNTSQPSPGDFLQAYTQHSQPGDTIFSFHMSSKLSGTYQSALIAARQITDRTVHVLDTNSASLGVALPAIMAVRWAAAGVPVAEIYDRVSAMIRDQAVYFLVDTLEYLHRHGRIGKAQALFGSLLNIKPVLTISEGVVAPVDKVRGQSRALVRLLELAKARATPDKHLAFAIVDAGVPAVAGELQTDLQAVYPAAEFFRASLGPTIGTHVGPGTVGIIINIIPGD